LFKITHRKRVAHDLCFTGCSSWGIKHVLKFIKYFFSPSVKKTEKTNVSLEGAPEYFNIILPIIYKAKSFGYLKMKNGAQLFGRVPHVAPEAWLHATHSPLSETEIAKIECAIGLSLPSSLSKFYRVTNGLKVFSCELSIFGLRKTMGRSDEDVRQPFCIITPNTLEKREFDPENCINIGADADGFQYWMDCQNQTIMEYDRGSNVLCRAWPSLGDMLVSEIKRISADFNEIGVSAKREPIPRKLIEDYNLMRDKRLQEEDDEQDEADGQ
jgi:hypothetical protein